jgi:hypothetical protein
VTGLSLTKAVVVEVKLILGKNLGLHAHNMPFGVEWGTWAQEQ